MLIITTLAISITSCGVVAEPMPKSWNWGIRPRPLTGVRGFPETDTDYGKGFKNGCENAWNASGKGAKDFVQTHINPILMSRNPDYGVGWWDGYEQCTYIIDWDVV
ncbi:MAG: hypothetical protein K0R25_1185 [Rickettsiaceae bacterium]|nr:hypothetical protein [Rickettsiaceae bacterium]